MHLVEAVEELTGKKLGIQEDDLEKVRFVDFLEGRTCPIVPACGIWTAHCSNTLPTILYYCNQSLAHFGLHSIAMEDCRDLCRLPISHFYHRLLRLSGRPEQDVERLQPAIRDYDCASYLKDFSHLTEPYEGIRETLEALRDMGIKNAVLTNKPDALAHSLTRQFFGGLMEACIGQTPQTISNLTRVRWTGCWIRCMCSAVRSCMSAIRI